MLGMLEAAGGEQGAREQTERVLEELARLREDAEKKKTEILSRQGAARIAREEAARVAREVAAAGAMAAAEAVRETRAVAAAAEAVRAVRVGAVVAPAGGAA